MGSAFGNGLDACQARRDATELVRLVRGPRLEACQLPLAGTGDGRRGVPGSPGVRGLRRVQRARDARSCGAGAGAESYSARLRVVHRGGSAMTVAVRHAYGEHLAENLSPLPASRDGEFRATAGSCA